MLGALNVLAFVLAAPAVANVSAPFGALYITSLPTAADVWIDGSYIGRTPLFIDGLRAGKHTVTVTKTGWKVQEVDQNVVAGVTSTAGVQLQMLGTLGGTGLLVLHGLLPNARVSVDGGAPKRAATQYRVPAGAHHITVRQPDGRYDRSVTVYADQSTHLLFVPTVAAPRHSAVVAPVNDYFPASAATIQGSRIVLRWKGHVVTGHLGDARFAVDNRDVIYDAPAGLVRGRLYLPLDLILTISGKTPK